MTRLSLFVLFVGMSLHGLAQEPRSGDLLVRVQDQTGAVISGSEVQVTLEDGQQMQLSKLTGQDGSLQFALLPAHYSILARAPGFRSSEVKVAISAGQSTSVNLLLNVGASCPPCPMVVEEQYDVIPSAPLGQLAATPPAPAEACPTAAHWLRRSWHAVDRRAPQERRRPPQPRPPPSPTPE